MTMMTKLALVALLGALAVFTGTLVLTLQVLILQRKQHLRIVENRGSKNLVADATSAASDDERSKRMTSTVTPSDPTKDIYLWKHVTPDDMSKRYAGLSYWNQVKQYLSEMGDATFKNEYDGRRLPPPSHIHVSLLQAAKHGQSDAQHYVATAKASGIWLTGHVEETMSEDFSHMTPETMLLWHMAAMDGNIEASAALGHRMKLMEPLNCSISLPYWENAAHNIIDHLEAEPHSRAKVAPSIDRHSLPEIHLHGGTSSQLSMQNKPDESQEAIQYYHLLSTKQPDPDVHAAYTLAQFYHYGVRGVTQNLTKARMYYEIAATHKHGAAAGQAGKFYFWALGMDDPEERDILEAHKWFKKGAPFDLEVCRDRYRKADQIKLKGQSIEDTSVTVCDHPSLNGMGLLHMYGVPMMMSVDITKARAYFQLARDMGNIDAAYNLAMLRLGFKNGWKEKSNHVDGTTPSATVPQFMEKKEHFPSRDDWNYAIQELTMAAKDGHLQARHRLAMIYQRGIKVGANSYVHQDCEKASSYYRWIVQNASPQLSERTRMAYKQYMAGDYEGSLVNYLMAAETGHELSQVNAAFLLERGVCLHLSQQQCRAASLRLWKAAAQAGNVEAALRVGDFYYYGSKESVTLLDVILFPEVHLVPLISKGAKYAMNKFMQVTGMSPKALPTDSLEQVCVDLEDGGNVCEISDVSKEREGNSDSDLVKAAHYYRLAATEHKSARANFNLGFMHEWGLGLTQDFPLAKRHYDLAKVSTDQAGLAVQLALMSMSFHEQLISFHSIWKVWNNPLTATTVKGTETITLPPEEVKTKLDVIVKHIFSWETLLILVLTWVLTKVLQHRQTGR